MWSQWPCVIKICPFFFCRLSLRISLPRFLNPVPQSKIRYSPVPGSESSMHEVLPPYDKKCSPGTGVDPRVPQNEIVMDPFEVSDSCRFTSFNYVLVRVFKRKVCRYYIYHNINQYCRIV